jgi:glutathione S-transferase
LYVKEVAGDAAKTAFAQHWILKGLEAFEQEIKKTAGMYSFGDQVTFADCALIPQLYNARRYNVDLSALTTILRVEEALNALPAFQAAIPANQPDAQ